MTRKFTPLYTSIWQDAEFVDLAPESQALYFTLISQPNINSVGLLPMTIRRWRALAKWIPPQFDSALDELRRKAFVVVDDETEELWIRTFIKWDGGVNHSLRLKAILKDAKAIQSLSLRHSIGIELARLGVTGIGTQEPPPSDPNGTREPTVPISSYVTTTGTGNPKDEPGEANLSADAEPSPFCSKHPNGTEEPCGPCGTAKARVKRTLSMREQRVEDQRSRLAQMRKDCPDCDDNGYITDPDGSIRKCVTHLRSAS
jgi:hypothetical protein